MQAVRIRPLDADDPVRWYRSVIVDFEEGQELLVLMPDEKDLERRNHEEPSPEMQRRAAAAESGGAEAQGKEKPPSIGDELIEPPPFDRGNRIEVEVSLPDGIRRFQSRVLRLELNYGGAMRIDWPTEGTRIQRRDFVRVEISSRAIVWYREEDNPELKQLNGHTIDLSAGGVRLKLPQPLPEELRIEMEIQNPTLKAQTLQGRVVRSGELERKREEKQQFYWVAVEFVGVDEGLRNQMTQLVFDIQREQMKKSLS